ncbi:hypothetical protein EB796_009402 [Bugula neritina]|uniref:Uncharacterized protein n=1 Tax=Bugula neritina TaxID=10212 RepID=A0A7J7K0U8_BUGNE|nr:hypothetical protein EB796_009421 [Bugula neritina]KAF6032301.1 hypothetical protein EB796_009402 [Bugula neritina]
MEHCLPQPPAVQSMKPTNIDPCLRYEMCSQDIASLNSIGDNISALFKLMNSQGDCVSLPQFKFKYLMITINRAFNSH